LSTCGSKYETNKSTYSFRYGSPEALLVGCSPFQEKFAAKILKGDQGICYINYPTPPQKNLNKVKILKI
jgi:hypothetical protein